MKILLDMDGVLVDLVRYIAERNGIDPGGICWKHGDELCQAMGLLDSQVWGGMESCDWAMMQLLPEAKKLVNMCASIADVYICSTPTGNPSSASGKIRWLQKHFPILARRYVLTKQKELLASPDTILIDDRDWVAERFEAAGGRAIVFPQPWNSACAVTGDKVAYVRSKLLSLNTFSPLRSAR